MTAPKAERKLRCSACGVEFGCGKDQPTCWCAELPPLAAPAAGEDCLCRPCLEKAAGRKR